MILSASIRLRRLAASICRRYGTHDAEDLAQLALLKVVELADSYQPSAGATFDTFVFRTARRVMVDACLAERRERNVALLVQKETERFRTTSEREAIAAAAMLEMFADPETPEQLFARAQERELLARRVHSALSCLNEESQTLVRACACEGVPLASAARSLGIKYSKARYALRLAMTEMEQSLRRAA